MDARNEIGLLKLSKNDKFNEERVIVLSQCLGQDSYSGIGKVDSLKQREWERIDDFAC